MKWLTREQVKKAAAKGKLSALRCCLKHWKQLATITVGEYDALRSLNIVSMGCDHCALCQIYFYNKGCGGCPLEPEDTWRVCCDEFVELINNRYLSPGSLNEKCQPLIQRIEKEITRELANKRRNSRRSKKGTPTSTEMQP